MIFFIALLAALAVLAVALVVLPARSAAGATRIAPRRAIVLALLTVAVVLSCGRDATAPDGGSLRIARGVSFLAAFPPALSQVGADASSFVGFTHVRVLLRHADGSVALDTVVNFSSSGVDQVTLSLSVRLAPSTPASGESMALHLAYVNAAGDTVFRGGPLPVLVLPSKAGDPSPPPVQIPVRYTGTGSSAATVRISPRTLTLTAGDNFTLTAVAADASGAAIANTPIVWSALDAAVATITSSGAGAGSARTARGTARIMAELLTGQADTVTLTVLPKLSALALVSGNTQTGPGALVLAQPLIVRASATDGLPMAGVTVAFAASVGGSVGAASVVTDAAGLAQTTWRLAPALGAQTLTASAAGVATAVTFNATSTSGPAAKLAITTQPVTGTAGVPLAPIVVTVQDALGNTAVTYSGAVTMTLGANPGGGTLSGTSTVDAVAGVATFSALRLRKAAGGYTLVASAASLTSATTSAFAVIAAPGATLALVSGAGQGAVVGSMLPEPIVVLVTDSVGNPVSGKAVTFAAGAGGATAPSTAVTADNGTASTKWTLGSTVGFQILNVSGAGLTPSLLGVGALASPVAQLQFVAQPSNTTAGLMISPPVTVRGVNAAGVTDTLFNGNVTLAFSSNPSGATLAGTLTVAAYRGVATFSTLRVGKAGSGYSLSASASGWAPATSTSFNVAASPAATVAVSSGNGQAGPTLVALANPLVVVVSDSTGNAVSGATVSWTTSNGSVTPTSSLTNVSGLASTAWTLGPTGGAQSATATVGALSPVTFLSAATAPPSTYSKTWTGATSTDWSVSTNWSPAGVPTSTDSTLIPVVTNQPVLSVRSSVGKVAVANGAVLSLGSFTLDAYGSIDNAGSIIGTTGSVVALQVAGTLNGSFTADVFTVTGSSLSGATSVTGAFQALGLLAINGYTLTVSGNATLKLKMVNAADSVNVSGTLTANASNTAANLSAGTIVVGGNFIQAGMYQSFPASGTHRVVMKGSSQQHIQFNFPASRYSHFNDLVIDNAAGVVTDALGANDGSGACGAAPTCAPYEALRHLTILNGILSGPSGTYLRVGGTLTDVTGGRLALPAVYFDSSTTPVSSSTPSITVAKVYMDGLFAGGAPMGGKRATLAGNLTINGNLYIQSGDTLRLNGHALTVNGLLTQPYSTASALEMTNSADVLTVTGDMNLYGWPTAGKFTAGTMYAGGALNASLFQASGTHKVVFNGAGSFALNLGTGDSTDVWLSRLNDLEIANTAPLTLSLTYSGLYVNGTFTKTSSAATTLKGGSAVEKLIVAGVNVTQPVTFDRVQFWLVGSGTVTAFNNASFKNSWYYPAEATGQYHFGVVRGGTGSYTFSGLAFDPVTPSTPSAVANPWGYVKVELIPGGTSLSVSLTSTSPSLASLTAGKIAPPVGGATISWTP